MPLRFKIVFTGFILLACVGCLPKGLTIPSESTSAPLQSSQPNPLDTPTISPTETLLPSLELPTRSAVTIQAWIDQPTLPESQPGVSFRVDYDASLWALTENELGYPALAHRQIPYCTIVPTSHRGSTSGLTIDDAFKTIGPISYEVVTASQNGMAKFVNYYGGDGVVLTGFQVSFEEQPDACLQDAETVLATLTSIPTLNPTP